MARRVPSNTATEMPPASKAPDVETAEIAARLRELRIIARLQQKQLATLANISPRQRNKYERMQQRIDAGTLFRLAKALKVMPNSFYCDETEDLAAGQTGLIPLTQVPLYVVSGKDLSKSRPWTEGCERLVEGGREIAADLMATFCGGSKKRRRPL